MSVRELWDQVHKFGRDVRTLTFRSMVRRIDYIFWHMATDPLELGIAFLMLAFSLQLLNPLYVTFGSGPAYTSMRDLAPEWVWGTTGCTLSLLNIYMVVLDNKILKIFTSFGLMVYVMFIAALIGLANPYGTGITTYTGMTVLMMLVTVRAAKDAV